MTPEERERITSNTHRLIQSLSNNRVAFNRVLDHFLVAKMLPEATHTELTVRPAHSGSQVELNVRDFFRWLRNVQNQDVYGELCQALKEMELYDTLSFLQPKLVGLDGGNTAQEWPTNASSSLVSQNDLIYMNNFICMALTFDL